MREINVSIPINNEKLEANFIHDNGSKLFSVYNRDGVRYLSIERDGQEYEFDIVNVLNAVLDAALDI